MRIRKVLLFLLSVLLIATAFTFVACNEKDKNTIPSSDIITNVTWAWDEDDQTATATVTLSGGATGSTTINATVRTEYLRYPDCENDGQLKLIATIDYEGATYTDERTITLPATDHDYRFVEIEWDGFAAKAKFVCERDESVKYYPAQVSSEVTQDPTCERDGEKVYTAVYEEHSSTKTETLSSLGHTEAAAVRENETEATCQHGGSYDLVVYCSVCGVQLSREPVTTPVTGHRAAEAVRENETEATCQHGGSYDSVIKCVFCGEELSREAITVGPTDHKGGEPVREHETAPTCEEEGSVELVVYCSYCGVEISRESQSIDPLDHDWEFDSFVWAEDYTSAQAKLICSRNHDHVSFEDAQVSCDTTEAGWDTDGEKVYTASYGSHTSEPAPVVIPAQITKYEEIGFSWDEGTWDGSSPVTFVYYNEDEDDYKSFEVQLEYDDTTPATCTTSGVRVYTATYGSHSEQKTVGVAALGHDYHYTTMIWNATDNTAYAYFTCSRDFSHYENHDAVVTCETTAATCDTAGSNLYTATVVVKGETYEDQRTVAIPALGHDYLVTWEWDGFEAATATFTCKRDAGHTCTLEARITEYTTPTTCTDGGSVVHTATVELDGETYTDEKTESTPAPGHSFAEEWSHDENYHWHAAICGHDEQGSKGAHTFEEGVCTVCGFEQIVYSQGLAANPSGSGDSTTYTISGIGTCTDTVLNIPAVYNGYPVTAIAANAFKNNTSITKVYVPDTVATIGAGAFSGCSNITEISLPFVGDKDHSVTTTYPYYPVGYVFGTTSYSNSTSVTQFYFYNSSNSTSAKYYLPAGLTTIRIRGGLLPYGAFCYINNMTIELTPEIKNIANNAFMNLGASSTVKFLGTVNQWVNVPLGTTGASPLERTANFYVGGQLVSEIESIDINVPGKTIGRYHFYKWAGLKTVVIRNAEAIAGGAFAGCVNIESITLPFVGDKIHEATDATQYTFGYIFESNNTAPTGTYIARQYYGTSSSSYSSYCIPNSLTTIVVTGGLVPRNAFSSLSKVKSITLPAGITTLGQESFAGSGIESIDIPDTVTRIEYQAFKNCSYLASISLSDNLTFLGRQAFMGCSRLIWVEYSIPTLDDYNSNDSPFYSLNTVSGAYITLVIGEKVEKIPGYMFYNVNNLQTMDVDDAKALKSIGYCAFYNCTSLDAVTIPETVETISANAFYNCNRLTRIEYRTDLAFKDTSASNQIFYQAGYYNDAPCEIVIGASVTRLAPYLFSYANGVTKVTVEQGSQLAVIGNYAFSQLVRLTEINLPASIERIEDNAFYSCDIQKVVFEGTLKDWLALDFASYSANPLTGKATTLYIDGQEVTELSIPADAVKIGAYALYRSESIVDLVIPDSVQTIGEYAFYGCYNLETLTLGSGLKNIGRYAFYDCEKLRSVVLPSLLEEIGTAAFEKCVRLAEVGNKSSLELELGSYQNGYVAYYALNVYDANTQQSSMEKVGDYLFITGEDGAYLLGYGGEATALTLPASYKDASYVIHDNAFFKSSLTSLVIPNGVTAIGENAFRECASLETASIANSVLEIGKYAFYKCTNLEVTSLSDSLKKVDDYAFSEIAKLCAITLSDGLTYIGTCAFAANDATATTTLVVPDSVTAIGSAAFGGFNGLTELTLPFIGGKAYEESNTDQYPFGYIFGSVVKAGSSEYTTQTYLSSGTYTKTLTCRIPSSLKKVTITGGRVIYGAFYGCRTIETIVIPGDVTKIFPYAFYDCVALQSVNVPDSVTTIDEHAFGNCKALTDLHIPSSLVTIGQYAFYYVPFDSVTLPATVVSTGQYAFYHSGIKSISGAGVLYVGSHAFEYCPNLEAINFPAATNIYENAFANCTALETITTPEAIKSLGGSAFLGCTALESVTLNEGLQTISNSAFSGCTALQEITLPSTLTGIYSDAFKNCTALGKVNYRGTLEQWMAISFSGASANPLSSGADLYIDGSKLESLDVPEGVTEVKDYAFVGINLSGVTFASTVTRIGTSAFAGGSSATTLVIPSTVEYIGDSAFSGWAALEELTIPFVGNKNHGNDYPQYPLGYIFGTTSYEGGTSTSQYYRTSSSRTNTTAYYIPSGLREVTVTGSSILYGAFYNCKMVKQVNLAETTTVLENAVFAGSGITSFVLPAGVTTLESSLFSECADLASVTLHENVTTINSSVFYKCASLIGVELPEGLTTIGQNAFYYCTALESISLPDTVTTLGQYAFEGCSSLVSAKLSSSMTKLDTYTFRYCSSLKSLVIPDSVTLIMSDTLRGCSSLEELTIPFVGDKHHEASDSNQYPLGYLFGTSSFDGATKTTQQYRYNSSRTTSGNYYIPDTLRKVTVMDTRIPYGAFYQCKYITEVNAPRATEIAEYVFYGCSALADVDVSKAESIGTYAFASCYALVYVDASAATRINSYAFQYCSGLEELKLKEITYLANCILYGSTHLATITFCGTTEEWSLIDKDSSWISNTNSFVIECSDGDVAKDGTVTAKTVITVDVSGVTWFEDDGALAYIYYWRDETDNNGWPGAQMTKKHDGTYSIRISSADVVNGLIIVRINPDDNSVWNQTKDLTLPEGHLIALTEDDMA